MGELLNRIPDAQDIFGLLRLWSPVWLTGEHEGYRSAVANLDVLTIAGPGGQEEQKSVALDLTDATGRAHAAWWVADRLPAAVMTQPERDEATVHILDAERSADMTPTQIDALARLVMRLAGRSA